MTRTRRVLDGAEAFMRPSQSCTDPSQLRETMGGTADRGDTIRSNLVHLPNLLMQMVASGWKDSGF